MILFVMPSIQAQTQTQTSIPVVQDDTDNASEDSFGDIARLGQQISLAQRKMQALTLQNSLDALEAQRTMGNFNFKVLRVEGFNNTLYAVLTDDKGVVYQVGPGDIVANQYRVSLIRPYSVGMTDINTRQTYSVPFVVGGVGAITEDFSVQTASVSHQPSVSNVSK